MEVMGTQFQGIVRERKETGGLYMDHPILILQWPFYQEKFASRDKQTLPFVEVWSNNDVGDAGFVLH